AANGFTNRKHLRGALRIGDAGEHAIGVSEMLRQHDRLFVAHGCEPDEIVSAIHHRRCLPVNRPLPDAFTLHMRIELEHGSWRWGRRIAKVDTVAVFIAAEAELEAGNIPFCKSLDPVNSLTNTSRNRLRTCPEDGWQTTLACEGANDCILRDIGQQAQG